MKASAPRRSIRVKVPQSTKGEWKRISWEGAMIDSRKTDDYSIGWAVRAGKDGPASIRVRNLCLEPLLTRVNPESAAFTCYWPGLPPCGVANCTLKGEISGRKLSARLDGSGHARRAAIWTVESGTVTLRRYRNLGLSFEARVRARKGQVVNESEPWYVPTDYYYDASDEVRGKYQWGCYYWNAVDYFRFEPLQRPGLLLMFR